jgi:hypothetical protein
MTTHCSNNTAQTRGALGYATAFLCALERHEFGSTGWVLAFVVNRTLGLLLGLPVSIIFAAGCWKLTDVLVPSVGNYIRFSDLWNKFWQHTGARGVLGAIDECGLRPALLDRLEVIGAVSILVVGLWAGNHVRRSIVGRGSPSVRHQFSFLTVAVLTVSLAIALCAIHRPPTNPVATANCLEDMTLRSNF